MDIVAVNNTMRICSASCDRLPTNKESSTKRENVIVSVAANIDNSILNVDKKSFL